MNSDQILPGAPMLTPFVMRHKPVMGDAIVHLTNRCAQDSAQLTLYSSTAQATVYIVNARVEHQYISEVTAAACSTIITT